MRFQSLTTLLTLIVFSVFSQNQIVEIDELYVNIDQESKLILINKNTEELNSAYTKNKTIIKSGNQQYTLSSTISNFKTGFKYQVNDLENNDYNLYFTKLPIIKISTNNYVVDEPRVYAHFNMCESNGKIVESSIGIEYRGGWTQSLPKKSYRLEFWNDNQGDETKSISLLGMRDDDDWNLQALYNEPLRLRSKVNFELWRKINELSYKDEEPKAINGIHQVYVELFFNEQYRGIYALSERVDRKQLKLKKIKKGTIRGELYKGISWGASTYTSLPAYDNNNNHWSGFEIKHPDDLIDWGNIYEFVDFVINEDHETFLHDYKNKFDIDNAVDYYIFLNTLRATDNTGKNLYVAKYSDGEPYFYVPWDLDGTYGIIWNGTKQNITNDILSNGFYNRLIEDESFTTKLSNRWKTLREEIITVESIMKDFDSHFDYLNTNGVYEREKIAYPDCKFLDLDNLQYTSTWLTERLNYLDGVFKKLIPTKNEMVRSNQLKVYPNPASHYITIESELEISNIQIINSLGQILYTHNGNAGLTKVNISNLQSGIYFIAIDYKNLTRQVEKIVIEKK
ncbi:MAG: CotH kinase family protein [Carboxylicivirga sp.]|jgi:hypothetical protein|nr:CotH kinase family protein [Carboxylicivirga sp.]